MAFVSYMNSAKLSGLINDSDPNGEMFISVLSSSRLAMGKNPLRPTHVIDFSKEAVAPFDPAKSKATEPVEPIMERVSSHLAGPAPSGLRCSAKSGRNSALSGTYFAEDFSKLKRLDRGCSTS